jgi:hypothetical protein
LRLPFVVRDFSQEFIYGEKIFTVDFKRPAAGMYNLQLLMTEDQYISKLQHDITDTTIQEVTNLVTRFFPSGLGADPAANGGGDKDGGPIFREIQSVVAVDIFEIDAPDFEQQMTAFANHHLNQAHDAWVSPPPSVKVKFPLVPEEVPAPAPHNGPPAVPMQIPQ